METEDPKYAISLNFWRELESSHFVPHLRDIFILPQVTWAEEHIPCINAPSQCFRASEKLGWQLKGWSEC